MIVLRSFTLAKILPYVQRELAASGVLAVVAILLANELGPKATVPFAPIGVLGTALAVFLGFRSSTGYARWWEARTIWGGLVNSSRTLARIVLSSAHNAAKVGKVDEARIGAFAREVVLRQIAFAHALRLHLRRQRDWTVLEPLLSREELDRVLAADNRPNMLLQIQSNRLKDGVREEVLGTFDPISLEPAMTAFNNWQGSCERIKNTPLPAQYTFYTRVFVWIFMGLMPFALTSLISDPAVRWGVLPLTLLVAFIYAITSKVGEVSDDPFENRVHDVPLTALCNVIERDLKEQLGDDDRPAPMAPKDGYLF